MKIQCDVCERAEATVLCCADEAALCWECDEKVHAANKLAGKHQRVPLFNPPAQIPKCDICQELDDPGSYGSLESMIQCLISGIISGWNLANPRYSIEIENLV